MGENCGGCMNDLSTFVNNPQFYLEPQGEVTTCLVSLLQFHPPSPTNKVSFYNCGMYVYELTKPKRTGKKLGLRHFEYKPSFAKTKVFTNFQEVVIRTELKPNRFYVIIPCTFYPDQPAQFLLRVHSDAPCRLSPLEIN